MAKRNPSSGSFDALLEGLKTEYAGTGRIQTGADAANEGFEIIPTGVMVLDAALGGGFPSGKHVDLYGAQGSGKCLPADAHVWTEFGLMTIREIFYLNEVDMWHTESEEEKVFPLINGEGEIENTAFFTTNGLQEIVEITTESGRFIRSTKNHPHLVFTEAEDPGLGDKVWVPAEDIVPGDRLVVTLPRALSMWNSSIFKFSEDQAYVIGVLTARGHVDAQGKPQLQDSLTNRATELEKFFVAEGLSAMDLMPETNYDFGDVTKEFPQFANVHALYGSWGTSPVPLAYRDIPLNIRLADRETLAAFIRGVVESTGSFTDEGIVLNLESKTLTSQLKLTLESLSVESYVRSEEIIPTIGRVEWRLVLPNRTISAYLSVIGKTWDYFWDAATNSDFDESAVTYEPTFDRVVSVHTLQEEKPTFDFTMENSHSFLVEGVTTHNTGVALSYLGNVQKQTGKPCVYMDQEKAFDPKLAALLGVDLDSLIKIRLPSAEKILQFIIDAARTNEVGCIILDSASNMASEAERQGEIGDATVGKVGRLTAQAIRVLDTIETDMTVIFINQTYANIGAIGHAPKTVAAGGSKIKFASSTRLHIQKVGKYEESGETVGHKMQVTVDKSRFSPSGGKKFVVNVIYGRGYDNEADILDAAVETGLFKKSGAWITDLSTGEQWNGATKFKEALRADENLRTRLLEEINEALGT